jgi:hypothetical protein
MNLKLIRPGGHFYGGIGMYDVHEVVEALSKLSYRDVLAYWIEGEREEHQLHFVPIKRKINLNQKEKLKRQKNLKKDLKRENHVMGIMIYLN